MKTLVSRNTKKSLLGDPEAKYYPEEGHDFLKREDQIDALTRIVSWFDNT
jgi:dipeptidyl aminopeptidase/acylaminoacyl peptidase